MLIGNVIFASCQKKSQNIEPPKGTFTIINGEDWTFPEWVKPKHEAGFGVMDRFSSNPLIRHAGTTLTWQMLNPGEGVYDFSELDKWLTNAKAKDGMVLFRLKASKKKRKSIFLNYEDGPFMPQWVIQKHNPATFYTMQEPTGEYLLYAAPWNEGVQQEFKKFTEEFGRRKYFENKNFLAVYLHGISSSLGEEFYIKREFTPQLLAAGLTKETLIKCFKDRMDWWSVAAGSYFYKLAWVGAGEIQGFDYPQQELNDYAHLKGFGERGGFIEHYFYDPVVPPVAGQKYEDGYVINDYSNYMHDGRIFSDESEEDDEFGDATGEELTFLQQSVFYQAARVGINFLWVNEKNIDWAIGTAKWYDLVAGKGPKESPDASCWLREAYVRSMFGDKQIRTWKNFERMLMQRDIEGAKTVATVKYNLNSKSNNGRKDPNRMYEYSARRTDAAKGQKKMIFLLDRDFEQSLKGRTQVKITYLDNSKAKWNLHVSVFPVALKFGTVEGLNDSKWKTVTFTIDQIIKKGALSNDASLIIELAGNEDVTVNHVRVVRLDE